MESGGLWEGAKVGNGARGRDADVAEGLLGLGLFALARFVSWRGCRRVLGGRAEVDHGAGSPG